MKSFLKTFFASWCGSCFGILTIIALPAILVAALIIGIGSSVLDFQEFFGNAPQKPLREKTFLVIDISRGFSDHPTFSAYNRGDTLFPQRAGAFGLFDTISAIETAAADSSISGILLTGSGCGAGTATLTEIRQALIQFRSSGKPVYAYLQSPSLNDYFLAIAANEIWMHPLAELPLNGLAGSSIYFKSALEKLGIGIQIVKVGTFKSAVEPLISDTMSDADRSQREMLLENRWAVICASLQKLRSVPAEKAADAADKIGFFDAPAALENKLVDAAKYADEVIETLCKKGERDPSTDSFRQIGLTDYMRQRGICYVPEIGEPQPEAGKHIAIIYAEGTITDGFGNADEVGGERLSTLIREIRSKENVRAAVLRVNSPGGSVFASEQIRRELELLAAKIPLVVSMGDTAASGGYWISTPARKIFAEPTTVTGSIGVFGVLPNFENLGELIGVSSASVTTGDLAELGTRRRPQTPQELAVFQKSVDKIYERFTALVAQSRNLPQNRVKEIAEGRVWDGMTAHELKLTDELGGLCDAVAAARELADDKDFALEIVQYPGNENPMQRFAEMLDFGSGDAPFALPTFRSRDNSPAAALARKFTEILKNLHELNDRNCLYARLPWDFQEDAQ